MGNETKQKLRTLQSNVNDILGTATAQSVPVITLSPANLHKMKSDWK